jgi:hypothetical protein
MKKKADAGTESQILTSRCREVFCSNFLNVIRQGTLILAGEKKAQARKNCQSLIDK